MRTIAFGFSFGVLCLYALQNLPSLLWSAALVLTIPAVLVFQRFRLIFAVLSGFFFALWSAHQQLNTVLPLELEGQDLIVSGQVHSIPNKSHAKIRFLLYVKTLRPINSSTTFATNQLSEKMLVRLNWYHDFSEVKAGDVWQLQVRLKRPNGFLNRGGLDYERWLFTQGIQATGYVRHSEGNQFLHKTRSLHSLREQLSERIDAIDKIIPLGEYKGLIKALTLAIRNDMSAAQWETLRRTGTSHLVAISGLHIGLIAAFAFMLVSRLWRFSEYLCLRLPAQRAAAIAAILAALLYALMAGLSLPTQRALIMLIAVFYGLFSTRHWHALDIFALALFAVLLWDPFAGLTPGFWLSFGAVGFILYFIRRQVRRPKGHFIALQLLLSLGLLPVLALLFGQVSLISPVANLLAIPWFSFVVVPLILMGTASLFIFQPLAELLLHLAVYALRMIWGLLDKLQQLPWASYDVNAVPLVYAIFAVMGLLWLFMPRGLPGRYLGAIFCLPFLLYTPERPTEGTFSLQLLDVGQGLAAVIQTAEHTLIYDTGDDIGDHNDAASLVILPYLRAESVREIDRLIVSHKDKDHIGGADSILAALPVREFMSSEALAIDEHIAKLCVAGQAWQWDGVDFEILHPPLDYGAKRNDGSCVLRVSNTYGSVLLTGDIEKRAERYLLAQSREKLVSDVLLVPHHGSKTSSTIEFIRAVNPQIALVSTGYRNRFGHPKADILARYQAENITVWDTQDSGMLQLRFRRKPPLAVEAWREEHTHFWNRR